MKLRARWTGALPDIGDALSSGPRARSAYIVCAIKPHQPPCFTFEVERIEPNQIPLH